MMRKSAGLGVLASMAHAVMVLARSTPFAPWRGVYRKPPRRRSPAGRSIIPDRSSSIRKLQRLARRGEITLREGRP